MLKVFCVSFIILIFPLFLNVSTIFVKNNKKTYFVIRLFFIKIVCGYIQIINRGMAIHLSDTKAIIIKYKDFLDLRKSFTLFKDYTINKIFLKVEIGDSFGELNTMTTSFLFDFAFNMIEMILLRKKNYLSCKREIVVEENSNCVNIYFETKILFNFLVLILSFFKIVGGRIIYGIKKLGK